MQVDPGIENINVSESRVIRSENVYPGRVLLISEIIYSWISIESWVMKSENVYTGRLIINRKMHILIDQW